MIPLPFVSTKDRSLIIQLVVAVVHPDAKLSHSRTFLYTHTFISRLAFNNRITGMDICSSLAHEKLQKRTVKACDFYLLFPVFTFLPLSWLFSLFLVRIFAVASLILSIFVPRASRGINDRPDDTLSAD